LPARAAGRRRLGALVGPVQVPPTGALIQASRTILRSLRCPRRRLHRWGRPGAGLQVEEALRVDLVERGYPPGQVIWCYRLDTPPRLQGRYLCGWRGFDDLGSTVTFGSFPGSLPARGTLRRCKAVASFGHGTQRGEIRNGRGWPLVARGSSGQRPTPPRSASRSGRPEGKAGCRCPRPAEQGDTWRCDA